MKTLVVILLVVGGLAVVSRRSQASKGAAEIEWKQSLSETSADKPRLLYFTASWCPPCKVMKADTWPDDAVEAAIKSYDAVYVDTDVNPDLAQQYGVRSIPTLIVIDADEEPVAVGNFMKPKEMVAFLNEHD